MICMDFSIEDERNAIQTRTSFHARHKLKLSITGIRMSLTIRSGPVGFSPHEQRYDLRIKLRT